MSIRATYFADHYGLRPQPLEWESLHAFSAWLGEQRHPVKENAALIKFAGFRGARADDTVTEIYGIESEYDGGDAPVAAAQEMLKALEIQSVLQETHSAHLPGKGHRWRVFCPLSHPVAPKDRYALVSKLNGALAPIGATLSGESWTLSQSYYVGSGHPVHYVAGTPLDCVDGIEPIGKAGKNLDPGGVPEYVGPIDPPTARQIDDLRGALQNIPADDREVWKDVGMRLKTAGAAGRELFETWSATSTKFRPDEDMVTFDGFAPTKCQWKGVFDIATQLFGWKNPGPQRDANEALGDADKAAAAAAQAERLNAEAAVRREQQQAKSAAIGAGEGDDAPLPAIMGLNEMIRRLVLVGGNAVADIQTGRHRGVEAAAREYAGSRHVWQDDGKEHEAPALKVWLTREDRISVDGIAWQPGEPVICSMPEAVEAGSRALNTWRGLPPLEAPDDWEVRAQPFVGHVAYLVPDEAERARFMQWLAHIVQRPEILPHTSYLFVTPSFGIGRGWLAGVLARVLRGHAAIGVDLAQTLLGPFNGRLSRKLIAVVEEVREGVGTNRYTLAQKLRDEITKEVRHLNPKYGMQTVEKNCTRWLMFSQHFDAVPFDEGDRRVIVIANPVEHRSADYYTTIYGLLDDGAFIGSVRRYLETLDISSFRPGEHAPLNAAKREAVESMLSPVDLGVREFLADCDKPLTTFNRVRAHVREYTGADANHRHLQRALERSGAVLTGHRINLHGIRQGIVIVRPDPIWTKGVVKSASPEALEAAM